MRTIVYAMAAMIAVLIGASWCATTEIEPTGRGVASQVDPADAALANVVDKKGDLANIVPAPARHVGTELDPEKLDPIPARSSEAVATEPPRVLSAQEATAAALVELDVLEEQAMQLMGELGEKYDTVEWRIYVESPFDIPESHSSMQIIRGYIGSRVYYVPVIRPEAEDFFRVQDAHRALSERADVRHALALRKAPER